MADRRAVVSPLWFDRLTPVSSTGQAMSGRGSRLARAGRVAAPPHRGYNRLDGCHPILRKGQRDHPRLSVIGVTGIPEVQPGDALAAITLRAAQAQGTPPEPGDVLVFTQKIVSKAEGALVDLRTVEPSALALDFAERYEKDARLVEVVLRETRRCEWSAACSSSRPSTA